MNYLFVIKQILNNAFLLISFLFIWGQFFKDKKRLLTPTSPVRIRVLCGIIGGVLGAFLMSFIVKDQNAIPVDFRNLAIIISAIYGGCLSSFITGGLLSIFTLVPFSMSRKSLIPSTIMFLISIGCGFISKLNISKVKKWIYMIAYSLILQYIFIIIFHKPNIATDEHNKIFIIYIAFTIIFGIIVYYLSEYINKSNLLLIKFKEDSSRDFMTGLNNAREFDHLFNDLSRQAIEKKEMLSLIMIDIDFFKKINDTYGHTSGDEVLKQFGAVLKKTCRPFDVVSRNGGEEFSVLLINCTGEQSEEIGERIRKAIEKYEFILPAQRKINITISVGIAIYPDTVNNIEKLKECADIALYEAKRTGRNKVIQYH